MTQFPSITHKQQEILQLLYRFRFLDRTHIQALLSHKDRKTINLWLRNLTQKQYVQRIYTNTLADNAKPAIYYLALNGIRFLKTHTTHDSKELRKRYREHQRSRDFTNQCLLLATIYLDLPKTDTVNFTMYVKQDYSSLSEKTVLNTLVPDAYLIRTKDQEIQRYLLEILPDTEISRLRKRIKTHIAFYQSNQWEGTTSQSFPILLMVCANLHTLIPLKRYARRLVKESGAETFDLRLTTRDQITLTGITGDIWEKI